MTDATLRQDIIDALDFERAVDAAHIGVAVEQSIATLTGHVSSFGQKKLVEDVVRQVKGVRGIVEEIEVRPFAEPRNSDEDIASRALTMIAWNTFLPDDAVQVNVHKGRVTLTGKLEWNYQRVEAEEVVTRLAGVTGVTNRIELGQHLAPADVKRAIEDALKRAAEIEAGSIRIDVIGDGDVRLEGKVRDWNERNAVERVAWSAAGVKTVEDNLQVA